MSHLLNERYEEQERQKELDDLMMLECELAHLEDLAEEEAYESQFECADLPGRTSDLDDLAVLPQLSHTPDSAALLRNLIAANDNSHPSTTPDPEPPTPSFEQNSADNVSNNDPASNGEARSRAFRSHRTDACLKSTYNLHEELVDDGQPDWKSNLRRGKEGQVLELELNVSEIAKNAPEFKGKLSYDELAKAVRVSGALPWVRPNSEQWTKEDTLEMLIWLQKVGIRKIKYDQAVLGVKHAALGKRFDPVADYLANLTWDGTPRLDKWLPTYFGVDNKEYTRLIGPKVLIGAVARALQPGCKVDTVLVLEGAQGLGKSSAIATLFGEEFVGDNLPDLGNKDAEIQIQGKWCFELAELAQLKRNEIETIKAFLARQIDRFRAPYEREAEDYPRRCVFIATTNDDEYLVDATGNRRFWPVKCSTVKLAELRSDRDQLWAEAVSRYRAGENWYLDKHAETLASHEQSNRFVEDAWADAIDDFLVNVYEAGSHKAGILCSEVALALKISIKERNVLTNKRISSHLKYRGWINRKTRKGRTYFAPSNWDEFVVAWNSVEKTDLADTLLFSMEPLTRYEEETLL